MALVLLPALPQHHSLYCFDGLTGTARQGSSHSILEAAGTSELEQGAEQMVHTQSQVQQLEPSTLQG